MGGTATALAAVVAAAAAAGLAATGWGVAAGLLFLMAGAAVLARTRSNDKGGPQGSRALLASTAEFAAIALAVSGAAAQAIRVDGQQNAAGLGAAALAASLAAIYMDARARASLGPDRRRWSRALAGGARPDALLAILGATLLLNEALVGLWAILVLTAAVVATRLAALRIAGTR